MISALHPNDVKDGPLLIVRSLLESVSPVLVNWHSFQVPAYSFTKSLKIERAVELWFSARPILVARIQLFTQDGT